MSASNWNVVVTARTAGSGMRGSSCSAISLFPLVNARTQSSSSSSCRRSAAIALSTVQTLPRNEYCYTSLNSQQHYYHYDHSVTICCQQLSVTSRVPAPLYSQTVPCPSSALLHSSWAAHELLSLTYTASSSSLRSSVPLSLPDGVGRGLS